MSDVPGPEQSRTPGERAGVNEVERLRRLGRAPVPPVDAAYASRLEAELRTQHASRSTGAWHRFVTMSPRLLVGAAVLAVALVGVIGLTTRTTDRDASSIDVFTQPEERDASVPTVPEPSVVAPVATPSPQPTALPTSTSEPTRPTPTLTPQEVPTAPLPAATAAPAETTPLPTPPPTPTTAAAVVPSPTATPSIQPTSTPMPTATLAPEPSAVPTATVAPIEATPVPTPTSTPEPTSTPVPVEVRAVCESQTNGDAVGVRCEWAPITDVDITGFRVMRTRNGGVREVVSEPPAGATTVIDRAVRPGDTIVYRILALAGDAVRGESLPIAVNVPG